MSFDMLTYINNNSYSKGIGYIYGNMSIQESVTDFIDTNEWVPVNRLPGWESAIEYYINREGQVMSTKGGKQKLLKKVKTKNGYHKVTLQRRIGQLGEKQVYVHTLVALAFIGNPPTPMGRKKGCSCVDHKDDDKANNHVDNLHWLSVKDNICKNPYGKFQKKYRTEAEMTELEIRKRENSKLRQRKHRAKKKLAKKQAQK